MQILSLSHNRLTSVPPELSHLANLEYLGLSYNQLTSVPPELGRFANLGDLRLSYNYLTGVPPELGRLANLQTLRLHNNQLTSVPPELGRLASLQILSLSNNHLTSVPPELGRLANLRDLRLADNQLTSLPPELGQLVNLQRLSLSGNQLTTLPPELGQLANLEALWLSHNQLTGVPRSFAGLVNLIELALSSNPLRTPPPEIAAQGAAAVRAYLARLDDTSVVRHEAKLLLVGEGGTGKSSLLRALRGQDFDAHLSTTHGVDVLPITLPCPGRDCVDLTLNVWDFGGQQIYHTTHQFFMTRRSLYLLAWNARGDVDQGRLDHWLRKIQVLAPGSPVLLVATHCDERPADLNLERFRAAYPQIAGLATVSNKTGAGIEALKAAIATEAAKLPLMEQEWPRAWVEVEAALLAADKTHINGEEFAAICAGCGVDDPFEQGVLGGYLHDLGKILYYQDDDVLCDFVVLKPDWLTGAMAARAGRRGHPRSAPRRARPCRLPAHLARLRPAALPGLYAHVGALPHLLPIGGTRAGPPPEHGAAAVAPQPTRGASPWAEVLPDQPEVRMVFDLDFVPDGIMSWFIVLTHHFSQDLHWREGVRLQYEGHQAHVELNPSTRQLWLHVRGPAP